MSVVIYRDPKGKAETVSFRINTGLRSNLEEEARKLGVNLNALVTQVLNRYMNWERYARQLKLFPVSKDLLREIFQPMHKDLVETAAKKLGGTSAREQILFLFQQINLGTVLRFIELWSNNFEAFEHRYDGRRHFYTLHHDVNLNFSIFTKEYLSAMFQNTLARPLQFENVSASSVTFSFEG